MKIVVCIKLTDGAPGPFDAAALEAALRIQGGEVTVVSMCPPSASESLGELTRLGIGETVLISDPAFAGSDTFATSYILSEYIKHIAPDLILCGRESTDGNTGQVGPSLAARLGIHCVTEVTGFEITGNSAYCTGRAGCETVPLPALLTLERIYDLRFPSLRSVRKKVQVADNGCLKLDIAECGLRGSPTRVLSVRENSTGRRKCRFIGAAELRSIIESTQRTERTGDRSPVTLCGGNGERLGKICAIGSGAQRAAGELALSVIPLSGGDAGKIAAAIREAAPDAVLWDADVYGRRTAPAVAALLGTGLCADCTGLEVRDGKLIMTRPAKGGNVMATVMCLTRPAMATVRVTEPPAGIIVAGGRGVGGEPGALWEFAERLGAERGASRALVESGLAPFGYQIGLTGRSVQPDIYIAVGISGAVQHICAISYAHTVIAINPDRFAPVFDYADYGIVCAFDEFLHEYNNERD